MEAEGSNACDEPVAVNNKNENSPKEPFNGPSPDNLDMGTAIPDGLSNELSDPDNLSEDDEVVLISDLQQFSSALQEAQCHAVELLSEKAKCK